MRPRLQLLSEELIIDIIAEAEKILCKIGIEIHHEFILGMLQGHGATIDAPAKRAYFTKDMVENALLATPTSFKLYNSFGQKTHDFTDDQVHFTPGSAAINILDNDGNIRKPNTQDYIDYVKVVSQLDNIASQSTALIPTDVPPEISDSYRLFLSLLFCQKPIVTGAFTVNSFNVMKDMQLAVRGSAQALKSKPLTIFSCCPTSPLKWSDVTSQNLLDCADHHIPVEFISMPLSGLVAPVTLVGTLIQHTAETLSGIVIGQLFSPGTPMLYGGSPAIYDYRHNTTPMGAIETMMIDCAYAEIGKYLEIPTQAYTGFSDAKQLDAQAGLESGMGAIMAALAGINNISGPGMLDFESCQSLEKLVVDNEICGMALKLAQGIIPKRADFPALSIFQELLQEKNLLIADHTRKHIKDEFYLPGPVIDRSNLDTWQSNDSSLIDRADIEIKRLLEKYEPINLPKETRNELKKLMNREYAGLGPIISKWAI